MQQNFDMQKLHFLVGDADVLEQMSSLSAKKLFAEDVLDFFNQFSKDLMATSGARAYPDVITLGFWLRRASLSALKDRFCSESQDLQFGRGVLFHIAPSNVPVNFAYSLAAGLLTGNANIVKVPSKEFEQVRMIAEVLRDTLKGFEKLKPYICLVQYERERVINDYLSAICDTRIIWGGDHTVGEVRKSPLPPRSTEITFADRFSLAVIDSDSYMAIENKKRTAEDFYNDTYLSDQNACTSPSLVVWTGNSKEEAKKLFWENLYALVKEKYVFQPIQAVNKLTSAYLAFVKTEGTKQLPGKDNLIIRLEMDRLDASLMDLKENSGYFFEYDCEDIMELKSVCSDKHCQTIGYIGDRQMFIPLLTSGMKGVDRVVPVGKTLDFDLLWDGYDLTTHLTRQIALQ